MALTSICSSDAMNPARSFVVSWLNLGGGLPSSPMLSSSTMVRNHATANTTARPTVVQRAVAQPNRRHEKLFTGSRSAG